MTIKPDRPILDEYGLTEYLYDVLKLCETPTLWKTGGLTHSIASLYKLRDRGLLSGPPTGKPHSVPFALSQAGRDLLSRVERGLHRPEWLTVNRVEALKTLTRQSGVLIYSPKIHGRKFNRATLDSLVKHGYLRKDFETYRLTDLGRETWAEWQQNPPSPTGRGGRG